MMSGKVNTEKAHGKRTEAGPVVWAKGQSLTECLSSER